MDAALKPPRQREPSPEQPAVQVDLEEHYARLRTAVLRMDQHADIDLVRRCFDFAVKHHAGQLRKSGEPYVVHPIAVACTIAELRLDLASVCAGLLHDTIEDTGADAAGIAALAGPDVQMLVEGVTKLGQIAWHSREEKQAENFRRMLLAMAKDIRVVLIKLCDRTDNMRTLGHMPREKQERISLETREIYAPMAHRLGISAMRNELEDLCFQYLEPADFKDLTERLEKSRPQREAYMAEVSKHLRAALVQESVPATVRGLTKHKWSIYRKVRRMGRDLDQLYDIMMFRIVTDQVRSCYAALGVIHTHWMPIPGRFKDFIALPKPNLYQSLHTTVVGPKTDRIEVQIGTTEMESTADQGVVARWNSENSASRPGMGPQDQGKAFAWLEQLLEWHRDVKDPTEFLETVKTDLFGEEVFVFTPEGDVKALPKGATPVDFAYAVHTKVGQHCSGARINGLIVPLRYVLRNGDTVEILTSEKQKPSKEWLKFVITSRARTRVRQWLRSEQRERSRQFGRDLLARSLRNLGKTLAAVEKDGTIAAAVGELRLPSAEEMYVMLGYGRLNPDHVARTMFPEIADVPIVEAASEDIGHVSAGPRARTPRRSVGGVRLASEADTIVRFGHCCSPIPGDPILAFITRGRGVVVHIRDCPKAADHDLSRRVDVSWDDGTAVQRPATVEVVCADKPGVLAELTRVFADTNVNIAQARCRTSEDLRARNTFQIHVSGTEQLRDLTRRLYAVEGVVSVARLHPHET